MLLDTSNISLLSSFLVNGQQSCDLCQEHGIKPGHNFLPWRSPGLIKSGWFNLASPGPLSSSLPFLGQERPAHLHERTDRQTPVASLESEEEEMRYVKSDLKLI